MSLSPQKQRQLTFLWMRLDRQVQRVVGEAVRSFSSEIISTDGTFKPAVVPPLGGDLSGTLGAAVLEKIKGVEINETDPADGEVPTYDATSNTIIWTAAGGSGAGHVIQNEGTPLPARAALNFIGALVDATDAAGVTNVTVTNPVPTHEAASNPHPQYATDADLAAAVADLEALIDAIDLGSLTTRWEPVTNGDPDYPELVFDADGDVVMAEVPV